ncbi:MAG: hypothetical protein QW604_01085 [Fervidicoccaceae archaeon]
MPLSTWDAGSATTHAMQAKMGGTLTTPIAPQTTDVSPNRCGEPVNPPREPSPFRAGRRSETLNLGTNHCNRGSAWKGVS